MTHRIRAAVLLATLTLGGTGTAVADSGIPLPPNDTVLTVHAGGTTAHINAKLAPGSAIAGQVTDDAANPLFGAQVSVLTRTGQFLGSSSTDSTGDYRIGSLPPSSSGFAVCVSGQDASSSVAPVSHGYVSLCNGSTKFWWSGHKPPSDARFIATQLSTTQTANMILDDAGGFTGDITARGSGDKLPGAYAYVYRTNGQPVTDTYASNGTYELDGLAPGNYKLCFEPPFSTSKKATGYVAQCYQNVAWRENGKPAKHAVSVATGPAGATINQSLPAGGAITGSVDLSGHSDQATGADVEVFQQGDYVGSDSSDNKGNYRIDNLRPGSYKVCAYTVQRILLESARRSLARTRRPEQLAESAGSAQCWKDIAWTGRGKLPKGARAVHVHAHKTASGVDFSLAVKSSPSTISGRITHSGGGVANAVVFAFRSGHGEVGSAVTNKHGKYRLGVAGSSKSGYVVCAAQARVFGPLADADHLLGARCWKDTSWTGTSLPKHAPLVHVAHGKTHKGINISLPSAGRIAGQVTFDGQPASDVEVLVVDTHGQYVANTYTDDDGEYVLDGISPAKKKYEVCFATDQSNLTPTQSPDYGFRPQCFRDQPWSEQGTS
jgi:protocatechuate 3,4-dioxygenase beta subunit